ACTASRSPREASWPSSGGTSSTLKVTGMRDATQQRAMSPVAPRRGLIGHAAAASADASRWLCQGSTYLQSPAFQHAATSTFCEPALVTATWPGPWDIAAGVGVGVQVPVPGWAPISRTGSTVWPAPMAQPYMA